MEATICLLNTHKVSMERQPRTFFDDVFKQNRSVCMMCNFGSVIHQFSGEKVHTKVHTSTYKI